MSSEIDDEVFERMALDAGYFAGDEETHLRKALGDEKYESYEQYHEAMRAATLAGIVAHADLKQAVSSAIRVGVLLAIAWTIYRMVRG